MQKLFGIVLKLFRKLIRKKLFFLFLEGSIAMLFGSRFGLQRRTSDTSAGIEDDPVEIHARKRVLGRIKRSARRLYTANIELSKDNKVEKEEYKVRVDVFSCVQNCQFQNLNFIPTFRCEEESQLLDEMSRLAESHPELWSNALNEEGLDRNPEYFNKETTNQKTQTSNTVCF